jgi:hypothetical protein
MYFHCSRSSFGCVLSEYRRVVGLGGIGATHDNFLEPILRRASSVSSVFLLAHYAVGPLARPMQEAPVVVKVAATSKCLARIQKKPRNKAGPRIARMERRCMPKFHVRNSQGCSRCDLRTYGIESRNESILTGPPGAIFVV